MEYRSRGGIVIVYRIGTIGPQWNTGLFQRAIGNHFFTRLLRSTVMLGFAAAHMEKEYGLNPVDHVADAIISVIENYSLGSATFQ